MARGYGTDPSPEEVLAHKIKVYAVTAGLIIVGLILFFNAFYQIGSGQEGVLLTWSQADPNPMGPGLHMKWPIAQSVVKYNVQTQKFEVSATSTPEHPTLNPAASKDLQMVPVELAVNYHIMAGKSAMLYTNVGPDYSNVVIAPSVQEATKATIAKYDAADLIDQRDAVSKDITELLRTKLEVYNIEVEQVSIINFDFSKQFNDAIEAKVTAVQLKQKADNDLQRIQVEADQIRASAKGQADAKLTVATAEAKSILLIQEALQGSPKYVDYIKATRWNGVMPTVMMSGTGATPFLDLGNVAQSTSTPTASTSYDYASALQALIGTPKNATGNQTG